MVENNQPLVSVVVVTYNSAKFIVETLDSIKNQTYQNIELIISDDCSKDNTVEICISWRQKNRSRFVDFKIITVPQNTGTAGNANRAWRVSSGNWIKYIAGDDMLVGDAIQSYIDFVSDDKMVCFADAIHFKGNLSEGNCFYKMTPLQYVAFGKGVSCKTQYSILKKQLIGNGPTFFVNKEVLEKIGGFDERYPLMDDYPLMLRISRAGYKFFTMPKATILYRNHSDSVSHSKTEDAIIDKNIERCILQYKYGYRFEHLSGIWVLFLKYSMGLSERIIKSGNSRHNLSSMFYYYLFVSTDPFIWYSRGCNLIDKLKAKK